MKRYNPQYQFSIAATLLNVARAVYGFIAASMVAGLTGRIGKVKTNF